MLTPAKTADSDNTRDGHGSSAAQASQPLPSTPNNANNNDNTTSSSSGAVRSTGYLGNFIRDPEERRAAFLDAAATAGTMNRNDGHTPVSFEVPVKPQQQQQQQQGYLEANGVAQPYTTAAGGRSTDAATAYSNANNAPPIYSPQQQQQQDRQPQWQRRPPPPPQSGYATTGPSGEQIYTSSTVNIGRAGAAEGTSTVVVDANGYINVDDIPVRLSTIGRRDRPWHYGLCQCCSDCDTCLESWCCLPCQVSRQCNMFMNHKPHIHWPFCILIVSTEFCTACSLISCLFVGQSRRMARERYGINGSGISDCCAAYFCRCCALQQVLLEMSIMNDFPGATCYQANPTSSPHCDVEMR